MPGAIQTSIRVLFGAVVSVLLGLAACTEVSQDRRAAAPIMGGELWPGAIDGSARIPSEEEGIAAGRPFASTASQTTAGTLAEVADAAQWRQRSAAALHAPVSEEGCVIAASTLETEGSPCADALDAPK